MIKFIGDIMKSKLFLWIALSTFMVNLSAIEIVSAPMDSNTTQAANVIKQPAIFGSNLFNGSFAQNRQYRYNPAYLVNIGDTISVKLWGAFDYAETHNVDTQGNIFIPKVGTVALRGVRNDQLAQKVDEAVKRIYKSNVFAYADLLNYQPVSIFVTGAVNSPGLYEGLSSDSVVQFIDKARGIDSSYGSYRNISVLRGNKLAKNIDLYEFLLSGNLELFQFRMGDVIVVDSIKHYVTVGGDVKRPYRFELNAPSITLGELSSIAVPNSTATNVLITKYNAKNETSSQLYSLDTSVSMSVVSGDSLEFISDHNLKNITVSVEGEHGNLHNVVLSKGATLQDLFGQITYNPLSARDSIQLFRKSVAERQKQLIDAQLRDLEQSALTTGSATSEEAMIRKQESSLILDFIKRARLIEPKGQVILNEGTDLAQFALEDGDKIYIPTKNNIVAVEGEVMLPRAQTYVSSLSFDDYIESSGGFSPRANKENVLIIHPNGKADTYNASFSLHFQPKINPGDSVLVLGKVDSKNLQIVKDITQILYQIAVGAAVVMRAF
jgi:protein involved in polysaccharide export with SLBB domain